MAAKRGKVSFILSVWRLVGCRGGGGDKMLRSAVLVMETGARKRRKEEMKSRGKRAGFIFAWEPCWQQPCRAVARK